jgi:uncharacterized protein
MASIRITHALCCVLLLGTAAPACAQPWPDTAASTDIGPDWRDLNRAMVDGHIIPRYGVLARATSRLDAQVHSLCTGPTETGLALVREGFATTLDAWNGIAHIRFGPVESEQRYFRFQLWPDPRGTGQRQVRQLLADQDSARLDPDAFAKDSVAVQGLTALEMLLYPEAEIGPADFAAQGGAGYRCRFALAIADNLAAMAAATLADWTQGQRPYRLNLLEPGPASGAAPDGGQARFADDRAVSAELLKALNTGVQVVHQIKLAGPLGASDQAANPHKAESWRSRRSLANVCTNLRALEHLYATGFAQRLGTPPESVGIDHGLALTSAAAVGACLSQPGTLLDESQTPDQRKALEDLRDLAFALQTRTGRGLAEALELMLGFNSLDGD